MADETKFDWFALAFITLLVGAAVGSQFQRERDETRYMAGYWEGRRASGNSVYDELNRAGWKLDADGCSAENRWVTGIQDSVNSDQPTVYTGGTCLVMGDHVVMIHPR